MYKQKVPTKHWSSDLPFMDYKELEEVVGGESKSPMIDVVFQNKGKVVHALLLVDSGSNFTVINQTLARRLGLKATGSTYDIFGKTKTPLCPVDRITICGSKFSGDVLVAKDSRMTRDGTLTDGSIGADILANTTLVLDAPRKKIFITTARWQWSSEMAVDLSAKNINVYEVNVLVNNKKRGLLLDTGAWKTTMSRKSIPPGSRKSSEPCYMMTSAADSSKVCDAFVNLKIANQRFPNLSVVVLPESETISSLGMDVLSSRLIVVDFPGKKMYFNP